VQSSTIADLTSVQLRPQTFISYLLGNLRLTFSLICGGSRGLIKRILLAVFVVSAAASAQSDQKEKEEYDGPSILSRDKSSIGERGGKLIDFRYYIDLQGVYDSGFAPYTTSSGNVANTSGGGTLVGWGLVGTRLWKRDRLSVEYHGDYNYYQNYSSGQNEFLNLHYARILSRRLTLDVRENAGTTYQANGYYRFAPLTSSDLIAVPVNDLFDIRTNFLDTRADITWQKSLRLSFSAGGTGFIVRRQQYAIPGTNGYDAHASVAYRLRRKQTVSLNYSHDWFNYQRQYGHADLDSVQIGYNVDFAHHWSFQAGLGGTIVHVLGLRMIPVDPVVTAILGITSVTVASNQTFRAPKLSAGLTRKFERSVLSLSYLQDVNPGNGVYLTSRQSAGTASYSYLGISKTSIGANVSYSSLSSLGQQNLGQYHNVGAGLGATYRVGRDVHLTFRYDYRYYTTQAAIPPQNEQRLSLGFGYSPGDRPLAIW